MRKGLNGQAFFAVFGNTFHKVLVNFLVFYSIIKMNLLKCLILRHFKRFLLLICYWFSLIFIILAVL